MYIINRTETKKEAKAFINYDVRWGKIFLACLPALLLANFSITVSTICSFASISAKLLAVISIFMCPFSVGIEGYCLNHIRGFKPNWGELYNETFDRYWKYFKVEFLTNIFIYLWSLLLIVPGVIKHYEYYFVRQIIHDFPNINGKTARQMSKAMTKGYKGKIFIMNFSFFPWFILSGLTLGIAMIYVYPYMQIVNNMYYEKLKAIAIDKGIFAEFQSFDNNNSTDDFQQLNNDGNNYNEDIRYNAPVSNQSENPVTAESNSTESVDLPQENTNNEE